MTDRLLRAREKAGFDLGLQGLALMVVLIIEIGIGVWLYLAR